jgi:putative phage-type endonuclease
MRIQDLEQGTEEWHNARVGVITGTRLKKVLGTQSKSLLYELLAESLAPKKEQYVSEEMENGTLLESDALTLYESTTGNFTESVGFVLHEEYDWLGVSPDALVKEGKKYKGAVEVKCPDTTTHIKYLVEGKIPTEYRPQVLQYFIVCDDIEWLDFVSYDPRIELPEMQLAIVRVTRKELADEIDVATGKLKAFREKWEVLQDKYII